VKTIEVEFREMSEKESRHFPPRPSKIELSMTRPTADGKFEVSFCNQDNFSGYQFDPANNEVAVQLDVFDKEGKRQDRVVKFIDAQPKGRYRVALQVKPEWIETSIIGAEFFTKQKDNPDFGKQFFVEGKGGQYRGMWTGSGAKIAEIPFEE
jgi:hypothetical protein